MFSDMNCKGNTLVDTIYAEDNLEKNKTDQSSKKGKLIERQKKQERLAAALRENLKKRKIQQKERT
jgi:tRNA 2-selenouridine synthase SelU